jgi:hypothetical protein
MMTVERNTAHGIHRSRPARTLHDLGLAAWFGGSLMGATGVHCAAAVAQDPTQRLRVANSGWARWTPLNLVGGAVLTGAADQRQQTAGRDD